MACTYSRVSVNGIDSTNSGESRYWPAPHPFFHAVRTRVVGGQGVLERSAELIHHAAKIARSQFQIHGRRKQLGWVVASQFFLVRHQFAGSRQQLHQSNRICARNRDWIEFRLLPDQRRHQSTDRGRSRRKIFSGQTSKAAETAPPNSPAAAWEYPPQNSWARNASSLRWHDHSVQCRYKAEQFLRRPSCRHPRQPQPAVRERRNLPARRCPATWPSAHADRRPEARPTRSSRVFNRRNAIEKRIFSRRIVRFRQLLQTLPP